jgi:hypothetical protein
MDATTARTLFDAQLRKDAPPETPGTRLDRTDRWVRQVGPAPHDWTGVVWTDLDEATADAAIADQLRWLATPEAAGREFEWKTYSHDRPADLGDRLRAAGFTPEPPETVMVADAAEIAESTRDARLPEGVRLVAVTDAAGVDLAAAVHEQAFGASAERLRASMLDQLTRRPADISIVLAMAGAEPVCSARTEYVPGTDFAGLWGGGTVRAWRGRGIYRALVAHRAREVVARGRRYLQVDASDQSSPILRRLGFTALSTTTPYLVSA